MCTAAYKEDVTSDRRRCQNVPKHILFLPQEILFPVIVANE